MRHALLVSAALALAPAAFAQRGYLADSNLDQLFSVDLTTGAATLIASTLNNGLGTPADLAWDASTSTLWTIDLAGGEVGTIDPATGTFTPVFQTGQSGWQAMALDPSTGLIYLNNQTNPDLYVLDPSTGVTTLVGDTGQGLITAMAVDANGTLWGIEFSSGSLVMIDKATAAATVLGTAVTNIQGMAFAPNGRLYAVNTTTDSLYAIDTTTAVATLIGAHGAGVQFAKGFSIPTGGVAAFGTGCRDTGGIVPTMVWSGTTAIGGLINLSCTTQPGAPFALLLGFSSTASPLGPLPFDLTPLAPSCFLYQSSELAVGPFPSGTNFPLGIPTNPALIGRSMFAQGAELDLALNPLGFAFSNYLQLIVQ